MKKLLDIYFRFFKWFFNKLPILTNKTNKTNWDWLKLDKNETFTKVLGAFVFYGFCGIYLIIFKYLINSVLIYNFLAKINVNEAINKIAQLKLTYNFLEVIYFFAWIVTFFIIVKNHNKKPLIQKIK